MRGRTPHSTVARSLSSSMEGDKESHRHTRLTSFREKAVRTREEIRDELERRLGETDNNKIPHTYVRGDRTEQYHSGLETGRIVQSVMDNHHSCHIDPDRSPKTCRSSTLKMRDKLFYSPLTTERHLLTAFTRPCSFPL